MPCMQYGICGRDCPKNWEWMWNTARKVISGWEKTENHLQILRGLTQKASSCGLDVRMLDGGEVRQINPYLSGEVIGASFCPTDGHANPLKATLAIICAQGSWEPGL